MEATRIAFEPFLDDATQRFLVEGLNNHNVAMSGLADWCPINFVLRGARGDVLGGVLGQLWGGWLQVTCLWVAEAARGGPFPIVIPAKAGIHVFPTKEQAWMPACAGMTNRNVGERGSAGQSPRPRPCDQSFAPGVATGQSFAASATTSFGAL